MSVTELSGDDGNTSRTYVFQGETHTLGNALRSVISSYSDVEFCGYTVPHPSEDKIHFRIQTRGPPAIDLLRRGFKDLEKHCEHIEKVFTQEVAAYKAKGRSD